MPSWFTEYILLTDLFYHGHGGATVLSNTATNRLTGIRQETKWTSKDGREPRRHKIVHISSPIRLNRMDINPQWLYRPMVVCMYLYIQYSVGSLLAAECHGSRHCWWTSIFIISLAIMRHGRGSEGSWPAGITQDLTTLQEGSIYPAYDHSNGCRFESRGSQVFTHHLI